MDIEKARAILLNRMTAIKNICNEFKKKADEERMLKRKIIEMSKNHNISNMALLRRFANPIKDPDPLASTMIALSYKYPIMMKKEYIKKFSESDITEYIEPKKDIISRRPGWVGCKKELVNIYIEKAELPNKETKEVVKTLYKVEDEKVISYKKIDWGMSNIVMGSQLKTREKVKMQTPIVQGLKEGHINLLIHKILSPDSTCSPFIQEIYSKNKDKLCESIPQMVTIAEQANALRNVLDSKERYLPILQMKFPGEMYQHATSLFSSTWQMEAFPLEKEEGELTMPSVANITPLCNMFLHCLSFCSEPPDYLFVSQGLFFQSMSFYDLLSLASEQNNMTLNYTKLLCGIPAANTISIKLNDTYFLYPNDILSGEEYSSEITVIHFSTDKVNGICHFSNDRINLNMQWATYSSLREAFFLFKYLQFLWFKRPSAIKEVINSKKTFLEQITGHAIRNKLEKYLIGKRLHITEKNNYIMLLKERRLGDEEIISNMSINTQDSPDLFVINETIASAGHIMINSITKGGTSDCVFHTINGKKIINLSYFIKTNNTEKSYFRTNEQNSLSFTDYTTFNFLRALEFDNRIITLMKHLIENINTTISNISQKTWMPFYSFFTDFIKTEQLENLGYVCYNSLMVLDAKEKLSEMPPEMIAFYYIWARDNVNTGKIVTVYNLKGGYIIDLDFSPSNQTENNLLWIDESNKMKCFSFYLSDTEMNPRNYTKMLISQSQYNGYRFEIYENDDTPSPLFSINDALLKLSNSPDGDSVEVNHLGVIMTMTRDRGFLMKENSSYKRILRGLKRAHYLDSRSMDTFALSSILPKRRRQNE